MFFKNALYGSNYFEGMGLTYLGPIDGNDLEATETLLREAKKLNESVLVHIKTQKGKGYEPAEKEPASFHGMQPKGVEIESENTFSGVFGRELCRMGAIDSRICAITAAMSDGTGLEEWKKTYTDRFFDVGIAEEHALTFAAGLAANGMKPCAAIYSTFLQRGYDNIIHDIALQSLPVVIAVDRAGLNPKDGATHHGIFDVAFLSQIPNVSIYTPITYEGVRASLNEAFASNMPTAIRYPSGQESEIIKEHFYADGGYTDIGLKCDFARGDSKQVIIVTYGRIVKEAIEAEKILKVEGISVGIILMEKLKPYGETCERIIGAMPDGVEKILFLEEEIRSGGAGMNLADKMCEYLKSKGICYGILATDDDFVTICEAGKNIYESAGVDKNTVCQHIRNMR